MPHANTPQLRPPFRLPILALHLFAPKLGPHLRFVHRRQPALEHLVRHVAPPKRDREVQRAPHAHAAHRPLVLVVAVDVDAHAPVHEVRR